MKKRRIHRALLLAGVLTVFREFRRWRRQRQKRTRGSMTFC